MCPDIRRRFVLLGFLLSAMAGGCDQSEAPVQSAPPPPVNVATPVQRKVQAYDEFTGRVAATETIDIRSRVAGYIDKIGFKDGDDVTKGQLLFEIDPRPYIAQLDQAKASLQQAQAESTYANRELARIEPLSKTGVASPLELAKAQDMVARSQASIAQANAAIEARQLDVDYASVKSPIDGRISKTNFSIGNSVSGDTVLTNMVSVNPIYVDIDVDEQRLLFYREMARKKGDANPARIRDANLAVFVALSDEKDFPHQGIIVFVDNQVDPQTGTIRARAEIDNSKNYFTPGQFVRVRFPRGDPQQTLIVPDRAIGRDQDRKYVLVVNDKDIVEYRQVETGDQVAEGRAVTQGLKAGERVVVDGLQRARPGQPVTPTLLEPTTQPTAAE
jgi:RND family efflux transporter MFP subunit